MCVAWCVADCNAEGVYRCPGDGGACIRNSQKCDDVVDCFDGSDELGCVYVSGNSQQNLFA